MLCRLASTSSGVPHSVVNHYPSPPRHPVASLSLPALSFWKNAPELEQGERHPLLLQSCQECLAFPDRQAYILFAMLFVKKFLFFFFSLLSKEKTASEQVNHEKCPGTRDTDLHELQEALLKIVFHKKGSQNRQLHSAI